MRIDGHCHCGEITFEAEVDPDALNICHCRRCSGARNIDRTEQDPQGGIFPSSRRERWPKNLSRSRPSAHREDVYFRIVDFFGGADFFRGAALGVGGLRASLTALPAWNRTALLAAIWMVSPVCGFRPSRAGRAATLKMPRPAAPNFNGLRHNSLRIGTGNLLRPCRELNQVIREFICQIRESRAGRHFTAT